MDRAAKQEPGIPTKSFELEGSRSGVSLIWRKGAASPSLELFLNEVTAFFQRCPDPYGMNQGE